MILFFRTFTGKLQLEKLEKKPHEAPVGMLISPVILASLAVIFGFFPNILSSTLIIPAMKAILPTIAQSGREFDVEIKHWHGFTPELFMTIGIIVIGTILFLTVRKWSFIYERFPQKLALNHFYDQGLVGTERGSAWIMKSFMSGHIRDYLVYIFVFLSIISLSSLFVTNAFHLNVTNVAPIGVYEIILSLLAVGGAVITVLARTRMVAIIAAGVVGYTISLFFVIFRAPDLALTQLVVETISVALFLLCFFHLPEITKKQKRLRFRLLNLLVSIGVGFVVTMFGIASHSEKLFPSISKYFVEESYKEAGGKNIVNVILVDFRGFDTLFEITVLGIAAFGIFAIVKLRLTKRSEREHEGK
jgi:multicomponent Na+:H+ antiporter subunit A